MEQKLKPYWKERNKTKTIDEYFLESNLNKSKFNRYQLEEINWGLKQNLDVSWFVDPKYSDEQMKQIRLGLEDNLDVSIYATPEFEWRQMEEIREKLLKEKKERIIITILQYL